MAEALRVLASLLVLGGCPAEDDGSYVPSTSTCNGGGVIDPEPTTSTFDSISLFGTVNLGNCDGAVDPATVTVKNVTTDAAGSGHASDPYCAAFFREYDVRATASLRPGHNVVEVHVQAGMWRACDTVEIDCTPCSSPPAPADAGIDAMTDAF